MFKLMPFGWLHRFILYHYFLWEYQTWFMPCSFMPTFSESQLGHKTRAWCTCFIWTLLAIIMWTVWQTFILIISFTVGFHHFLRNLFRIYQCAGSSKRQFLANIICNLQGWSSPVNCPFARMLRWTIKWCNLG
jgi:hypothetical protein